MSIAQMFPFRLLPILELGAFAMFRTWVVSIAVALSGSANAQERVGEFILYDDIKTAVLQGLITSSTSGDFDQVLAQMPDIRTLALNSGGGQVVAALDVANKVHALGLETIVISNHTCASACSIIFLAGADRMVTGRLGVHQLSSRTRIEGGMQVVQFMIADILDAFQKFGVDLNVTKFMLTTPPEDMYYFSDVQKEEYGINRNRNAMASVAHSEDRKPELRFADYPVTPYVGAVASPQYRGNGEWARNYRTRVAEGMAQGPNFAGSYTIIEIGCGSSCRFAIMVDVSDGEIMSFPLGGEDNYQLHMTYSTDSRLLKAVWMDTDKSDNFDTCVAQDYVLEGREMRLVAERYFTIPRFDFCTTFG